MKVTVVQPAYYSGEAPDVAIAGFLKEQLALSKKGELIVLPEYSNAGGLSEPKKILEATLRAGEIKELSSKTAKEKDCYVCVNVIEKREEKIYNSSYLYNRKGEVVFRYDKIHLPPFEVRLGINYGGGDCCGVVDGIRFAFMTCYDVYYNEQIEFIAKFKPDVILIPGYQRGERADIIRAQIKLLAFRCNAYVLRASYSMNSEERGGCSMIASPNGEIIKDMAGSVGSASCEIDVFEKYMRPAGFGEGLVRNDDFISTGLRESVFKK